ncbi:MAG: NnrS family protein [Gammaproteobacteria bacterium]|nr:NnrS family protein [Gammaproteobacteria bacterium]
MALLPNGQITNDENQKSTWPFIRLAFRPFFWLGALFSALSIGTWSLTYTGQIEFSPYGGSYFWHIHEMLFGFTIAIICGFLLTAVQTWTGVASIKGKSLAALVSIWLLARVLMAFPIDNGEYLIAVIDMLFLPLAAIFLAIPIIKVKLWRNLIFVPVLLVMAVINSLMHFSVLGELSASFVNISHVMVLMVTLVMTIMGGRVFPMFTANGTQTKSVDSIGWLEALSIISVICSVLVTAGAFAFSSVVEASIFLVAGTLNFIRALRWRIWVTHKNPLVWSLHLSYWANCTGLIMLGLEKLGGLSNASYGYHSITVGGIGLMILSMISRVSLGHTGRTIAVGKIMVLAFIFILLAFVTRVVAPILFGQDFNLIISSAVLWVLAYGAFVVNYMPVLFKARVDGRSE